MSGRKLIFQGHRWSAADAQAEPVVMGMTLADGTLLSPQNFVEITTTGDGRAWTPEPVDATWRDLAELDLADPDACEAFARRRGDPSGGLSKGRPQGWTLQAPRQGGPPRNVPHPAVPGRVVTSQWWPLAMALQQAARGWTPPDELGVSYPIRDSMQWAEAWRFLDHPVAQAALDKIRVTRDPDGLGLADKTSALDGFLIMRAALALERKFPMTRCSVCGSWFDIRRPNRAPRYCSATCRTIHHQQQKEILSHGIGTEERHAQRNAALAGGVERARPGRQHPPTHKKLRPAKRGARARQPHGAGDRRPRRR